MVESKQKRYFVLFCYFTVREIMSLHQSVSGAEFDRSLFCSTDRQIETDDTDGGYKPELFRFGMG